LDLTATALLESPDLGEFSGRVSDSGEGRWTSIAAIEEGVPAYVLTAALYERFSSRGEGTYANKVLSAMRKQFGAPAEQPLSDNGRLAGTGYLSILPVDQGIEHSAGASFAKNPDYFDPARIVELAIEGNCNAVATTLGVLGAVARRYAHRIPFLLKLNHNEFLSYPNAYDQIMFGSVRQASEQGCVAVGATIYF